MSEKPTVSTKALSDGKYSYRIDYGDWLEEDAPFESEEEARAAAHARSRGEGYWKSAPPTEGDMWMSLNAMYRRLAEMEERLRKVEARPSVGIQGLDDLPAIVARDAALKLDAEIMGNSDPPPVWTGSIQGLEGEFTVTPPPGWEENDRVTVVYDGKVMKGALAQMEDGAWVVIEPPPGWEA